MTYPGNRGRGKVPPLRPTCRDCKDKPRASGDGSYCAECREKHNVCDYCGTPCAAAPFIGMPRTCEKAGCKRQTAMSERAVMAIKAHIGFGYGDEDSVREYLSSLPTDASEWLRSRLNAEWSEICRLRDRFAHRRAG